MKQLHLAGMLVFGVLPLGACSQKKQTTVMRGPNDQVSQTTVTAATLPPPEESPNQASPYGIVRPLSGELLGSDDPIVQLGQAMCERKLVCGKIGTNQVTTSMQTCRGEASGIARQRLGALQCSGGFDLASVRGCMVEVRAAPCDDRLDVLSDIEKCQAKAVCK